MSDFPAEQLNGILHHKLTGGSRDHAAVSLLATHRRIKRCLIDNNRADLAVRKRLDKLALRREHGNLRCRL